MHPSFDLNGKRCLIVGACSAIGQAIAEMFLAHHGDLILLDVPDSPLLQLQQRLTAQAAPQQQIFCQTSALDTAAQRQHLIDGLIRQFGCVDVLVYVAGIQGQASGAVNFSDADFEQVMNINLNAPRHISQLLLPVMQQQQAGSLIFVASIAAIRGNRHIGLYAMSKAALCQMARNIAVEYGPQQIRANCILPGLIDTPFAQNLMNDPEFMRTRLLKTPLRRVGQAAEIAAMAVLLASDGGGFITGQSLVVDGGTTISD